MKRKKSVFILVLTVFFVLATSHALLAAEQTVRLAVPGCV
jgi:hypothetical protein